MPATPPASLSYDVFVSDGPQRAGEERMPDGSPLVWSPLSSTLISAAQPGPGLVRSTGTAGRVIAGNRHWAW
jgi:hypothetical protein